MTSFTYAETFTPPTDYVSSTLNIDSTTAYFSSTSSSSLTGAADAFTSYSTLATTFLSSYDRNSVVIVSSANYTFSNLGDETDVPNGTALKSVYYSSIGKTSNSYSNEYSRGGVAHYRNLVITDRGDSWLSLISWSKNGTGYTASTSKFYSFTGGNSSYSSSYDTDGNFISSTSGETTTWAGNRTATTSSTSGSYSQRTSETYTTGGTAVLADASTFTETITSSQSSGSTTKYQSTTQVSTIGTGTSTSQYTTYTTGSATTTFLDSTTRTTGATGVTTTTATWSPNIPTATSITGGTNWWTIVVTYSQNTTRFSGNESPTSTALFSAATSSLSADTHTTTFGTIVARTGSYTTTGISTYTTTNPFNTTQTITHTETSIVYDPVSLAGVASYTKSNPVAVNMSVTSTSASPTSHTITIETVGTDFGLNVSTTTTTKVTDSSYVSVLNLSTSKSDVPLQLSYTGTTFKDVRQNSTEQTNDQLGLTSFPKAQVSIYRGADLSPYSYSSAPNTFNDIALYQTTKITYYSSGTIETRTRNWRYFNYATLPINPSISETSRFLFEYKSTGAFNQVLENTDRSSRRVVPSSDMTNPGIGLSGAPAAWSDTNLFPIGFSGVGYVSSTPIYPYYFTSATSSGGASTSYGSLTRSFESFTLSSQNRSSYISDGATLYSNYGSDTTSFAYANIIATDSGDQLDVKTGGVMRRQSQTDSAIYSLNGWFYVSTFDNMGSLLGSTSNYFDGVSTLASDRMVVAKSIPYYKATGPFIT